jgi:hypothetical protein
MDVEKNRIAIILMYFDKNAVLVAGKNAETDI